MRIAAYAVGVSLLATLTVGCDTGPKCLETATQVVPVTTVINGRVTTTSTVVVTCVKREGE